MPSLRDHTRLSSSRASPLWPHTYATPIQISQTETACWGGHHYPSISALWSAFRAAPFWRPSDFTERCLLLWLAVCLGTCPKESACVFAFHLLLATIWNSLIPPTLELPEESSCTFCSLKEWDPGIEKGGTWKVAHVLSGPSYFIPYSSQNLYNIMYRHESLWLLVKMAFMLLVHIADFLKNKRKIILQ